MPSRKQNRADSFRRQVFLFYRKHGRTFPWRETTNPYHIFVSEIMLQQTQTERVVPKYLAFLKQFPSWRKLSQAKLSSVLTAWSGLGYNRRARFLHEASRDITGRFGGSVPSTREELLTLPGVGAYTAQALLAFIFNAPSCCIETNIRTVYLHYFFQGKNHVTDAMILSKIQETLPRNNFRIWIYALMDLGAHLKKTGSSRNSQSAHYTRQTAFQGSDRQVRGEILAMLIRKQTISTRKLCRKHNRTPGQINAIINGLIRDKLLVRKQKRLSLP